MSIEVLTHTRDNGTGGTSTFHDIIVWPPGMRIPSGAGETLPVTGALIPPYDDPNKTGTYPWVIAAKTDAAGETWGAPANDGDFWAPGPLAWQADRKVGSSYSAPAGGLMDGVQRWPCFAAGRRPDRGPCPPLGLSAPPAVARAGIVTIDLVGHRLLSGWLYLYLKTPVAPYVLLPGCTVIVAGRSGAGVGGAHVYNRENNTAYPWGGSVTYIRVPVDPGLPADDQASTPGGTVSILTGEFNTYWRGHSRVIGARPACVGGIDIPSSGRPPVRVVRGASCSVLAVLMTGDKAAADDIYRLMAPYAPSTLPDFAIDANAPAPFGPVRVVWAAGTPFVMSQTPGAGCTQRNARARDHACMLFTGTSGDQQVTAMLPTHGDEPYPLTSPTTNVFPNFTRGGSGVRGSQQSSVSVFPSALFLSWDLDDDHRVSIGSVSVTWHEVDHTGQPGGTYYLNIGPQVGTATPLSAERTPGTGEAYAIITGGSVGAPPNLGDAPRCITVRVRVHWTGYTYDWETGDIIPTSGDADWWPGEGVYLTGDNATSSQCRADSVGAFAYWPWDIPRLAFADDDSECQYVGQAGYVHPPHGEVQTPTWTAPTFTRATAAITRTSWGNMQRSGYLYNDNQKYVYGGTWRAYCPATGQDCTGAIPVESQAHPIVVVCDVIWRQGSGMGGAIYTSRRWTITLAP